MVHQKPIAIVGMACRFPGGANNPDAFWRLLNDSRDVISEVPSERWDMDAYYSPDAGSPGKSISKWGGFLEDAAPDRFDASFFRMSPREATALDPQQRLLLEVSWEALENAGIPADALKNRRVGVYVGIGTADYQGGHLWRESLDNIDPYTGTGAADFSAAGRISYFYGFRGPSLSVDTACSSSLVAFHLACQALRNGECETALVAGVNSLLSPNLFVYLTQLGVLSPDGRCKAFDSSGKGYVRAEGCGVLVLKRLSDAQTYGDDVLALVRASVVNQDGGGESLTAPDRSAQESMIRDTLDQARLTAGDIDYIEAHGTGTPLGDKTELEALGAVFADRGEESPRLVVGSVKTNIGHLEAASGIAGVIKTILMMQKRRIPAHLHFHNPLPTVEWDRLPIRVPTSPEEWTSESKPRRAGVSAFGLGGTNAHVVLEESPPVAQPVNPGTAKQNATSEVFIRPLHILVLSARNEDALSELAGRYIEFLDGEERAGTADVCFTAAVGRTHFSHRLAVLGSNNAEIRERLQEFVLGRQHESVFSGKACEDLPRIAFLFGEPEGDGTGFAEALYRDHPVFRRSIMARESIVHETTGYSPVQMISDTLLGNATPLDGSRSRVLAFVLEYALAELWNSWGIIPDTTSGEGLGSYVSAALQGDLGFDEALAQILQEKKRDEIVCGRETEALDGIDMFLEIGSSTRVRNLFEEAERISFPSYAAQDDWPRLLSALGELYVRGALIDWRAFDAPYVRAKVPLPLYPFQRKVFYKNPVRLSGEPRRSTLSSGVDSAETSDASWENLRVHILSAAPEKRRRILKQVVYQAAQETVGKENAFSLIEDQPLVSQGFDSLMAVELRNRIGRGLGIALPVTLLFNYPTIHEIAGYLITALDGADSVDNAPFIDTCGNDSGQLIQDNSVTAAGDDEFEFMERLDKQDLERLIEQDLDSF